MVWGDEWEQQMKLCTDTHFTFSPDFSSMGVDDSLDDRKSKPRAKFFGGVERLKNMR